MIVREILENPDEVLEHFDYFNDYDDTKRWLDGLVVDDDTVDHVEDIEMRLSVGFCQYLDNLHAQ